MFHASFFLSFYRSLDFDVSNCRFFDFPQTASSCMGSGGFDRGAGGLDWTRAAEWLVRFAVKNNTQNRWYRQELKTF